MNKRVCLVTGAGGRLGQTLCRRLAERHNVVAVYRRTPPRVDSQLAWRTNTEGNGRKHPESNVYCIQGDLSQRDDVRRIVEVALARFGFIDSVVNAAADTKFHGKLTELWDADEYAPSQLFANCVAPLRLVSLVHRACWRDRTAANAERNRSVVNVSSVSGLYVFRDSGQAFYAASKAALNILTMYLALELAPYSVRANALCPGRFTEGDSTEQVATNVIRLLEGTDTGMVTRGIVAERRLSRSGPRRGKTASE